jgi:ankyrin repeat protein
MNIKNIVKYIAMSSCLLSTNYVLGTTPLHVAAEEGDVAGVRAALVQDIDVDALDGNGRTALHLAALNGHVKVVELLLAAPGIDVNAQISNGPDKGQTALHLAAANGHLEVVELLLRYITDVNVQDECGMTALHWAAGNGHVDVVKLLLPYTVDVNARIGGGNLKGWTALHMATEGDVVQALSNAGANLNATDEYGWTPLHWAARNGHTGAVRALLDARADVNAQISGDGFFKGWTALDVANEYCRDNRLARAGIREVMLALLQDHGAKTRAELAAEREAEEIEKWRREMRELRFQQEPD